MKQNLIQLRDYTSNFLRDLKIRAKQIGEFCSISLKEAKADNGIIIISELLTS